MEVSNNFTQPCEATLDVKGQPRPLFRLFFVFSNKQYNFYNKSMRKNVQPVYGAGIQTHDLSNISSPPICIQRYKTLFE